jgi:hypothetical protein
VCIGLVDELVELGHDVTLVASGDSSTQATLVPALRLPLSGWGGRQRTPTGAYVALLEAVARRAQQFFYVFISTS